MTTQTFTGTLTVLDCSACGMTFGITPDFERRARAQRFTFLCPSGHKQWFPGKTTDDELREARARAERLATGLRAARDQTEAAERSARAYRGHVTRLRNLIARGVCPVAGCRRNFTNVREHMASEHPDFHGHEVQS